MSVKKFCLLIPPSDYNLCCRAPSTDAHTSCGIRVTLGVVASGQTLGCVLLAWCFKVVCAQHAQEEPQKGPSRGLFSFPGILEGWRRWYKIPFEKGTKEKLPEVDGRQVPGSFEHLRRGRNSAGLVESSSSNVAGWRGAVSGGITKKKEKNPFLSLCGWSPFLA